MPFVTSAVLRPIHPRASGCSDNSSSSSGSNNLNNNESNTAALEYLWSEMDLLLAYEAYRRCALQLEHALDFVDPVAHPWKVTNLHTWLCDFYLDNIRVHCEDLENFVIPFYADLGSVANVSTKHDHRVLEKKTASVAALSTHLFHLVNNNNIDKGDVEKSFESLKSGCADLKVFLFAHLEDEELLWPAIFERHGEKEYFEMKRTYITNSRAKTGAALLSWEQFQGCVLAAAGYRQGEFSVAAGTALDLDVCLTKDGLTAFLNSVPAIIRKTLLPDYREKYEFVRMLIESVTADEQPSLVSSH